MTGRDAQGVHGLGNALETCVISSLFFCLPHSLTLVGLHSTLSVTVSVFVWNELGCTYDLASSGGGTANVLRMTLPVSQVRLCVVAVANF